MDYSKPLTEKEWAQQANLKQLESIIECIEKDNVQVWAEELCRLIPHGAKCLEIGCGTGVSSLWLAKNGRFVTALDYTQESVELVNAVSERLGITITSVRHDATKNLPFEDGYFDYIFQCGLLEHFSTEEQIDLIRLWSSKGKKIISMIPNASSLGYRVGKQIMEERGTWRWGLEIPKSSLQDVFERAGLTNIQEYTIGSKWALKFLPDDHYLKDVLRKLIEEKYDLDSMMQGYLLVTVGDVCDRNRRG